MAMAMARWNYLPGIIVWRWHFSCGELIIGSRTGTYGKLTMAG